MPTEARGNYLPEPPYLRRDKGLSQPAAPVQHDMLAIISSRYQYGPFLYFVAEVMSNYLTTDGLKNFLYFRRPP